MDARSRNAGDDLASQLGDLVAEYQIESVLALDDFTAGRLLEAAHTIDAIRLSYVRGEYRADYAELWRDAAREHIADTVGYHTMRGR